MEKFLRVELGSSGYNKKCHELPKGLNVIVFLFMASHDFVTNSGFRPIFYLFNNSLES